MSPTSVLRRYLSGSEIMTRTYDRSRWWVSKLYRSLQSHDRTDEYQALSTDRPPARTVERDDEIFDPEVTLSEHPDASNPVLTRDDIEDVLARFVADPFVVYADGLYNMFFEIKCVGGDVFIGHAFSQDGVEYTYNRVVIEPETAQHTYPYVFWRDGTWLMVPSPGADINGQFRVYEAVDFPVEWRLRGVPIPEGVRQDPTPVVVDGTWFLIYQDTDNWNVRLKYADSLTADEWLTHPNSPLFENDPKRLADCSTGGAEMVPSGRPLYRDDGVDVFYRSHLHQEVYRYRITEATATTFRQHRCSEPPVFADRDPQRWNRRFMHTVNPVYPWQPDPGIVAVDGLRQDSYTWSIGVYTPMDR